MVCTNCKQPASYLCDVYVFTESGLIKIAMLCDACICLQMKGELILQKPENALTPDEVMNSMMWDNDR